MNNYERHENTRGRNPGARTGGRSTSYTDRRTAGGGRNSSYGSRNSRQGSSYRSGSSRRGDFYGSGGGNPRPAASRSGGSTVADERGRLRAHRKKKRRRFRRRLLLGSFFLLLLLLVAGAVYGFVQHSREKKRQELLKEGVDLLEASQYDEAISRLDEALKWSGKGVGEFETAVLLYRAEAEFRLEDYDAALNTYGILRKEDAENRDYQKAEAYCLVKKGDYDGALALGVIDGYVCNLKAVEQMNAGEYDAALEWIEKGKAAGDSLQDLAFNEAAAWENKGEFARALELFEAYEAEYGTDENVEHELIFLRSRQGSNEGPESGEGNDGGEHTVGQEAGSASGEGSEETSGAAETESEGAAG